MQTFVDAENNDSKAESQPSSGDVSSDPALEADAVRLRDLLFSMGRRQSIRDPIATICEDLGFSPAQLHCLLWLGTDLALTMGELSRRVGITDKTMTGIVDRLETSGHIFRERDTADRRVVRVKLTRSGSEVFQRIDSAISRRIRHALNCLDALDRESLFNLFQKLHDRLTSQASGEETK